MRKKRRGCLADSRHWVLPFRLERITWNVCMYVCMCMCVYVYVYVCVCVWGREIEGNYGCCITTPKQTYTETYVHAFTHTHVHAKHCALLHNITHKLSIIPKTNLTLTDRLLSKMSLRNESGFQTLNVPKYVRLAIIYCPTHDHLFSNSGSSTVRFTTELGSIKQSFKTRVWFKRYFVYKTVEWLGKLSTNTVKSAFENMKTLSDS